ncbi:skin secretory protein xP2-like [Pollicipes pollicipes]|uniref:skin secretory protein xP2-like n=1 Tax=Pollicipes pollicipes TaxID=41117 RepID=UPI0018855DEF|nr:skin secretory protein xP2-like [Pollicipes pollicipes]
MWKLLIVYLAAGAMAQSRTNGTHLQLLRRRRQQYSAPAPAPQPSYAPAPATQPSYAPAPSPQPSYAPSPAPQPSYAPPPSPQPSYAPDPAPQPSYSPAPAPQPSYAPSSSPPPSYAPAPAPQPSYAPAPATQPRFSPAPAPEPSYAPAAEVDYDEPVEYNAAAYSDEPAKYDFQWGVKDDYGNDYGHKESRDGNKVQGTYYVQLPDTRKQTVNYHVDGQSGFIADVQYEGEAQYPQASGGKGYQAGPAAGTASNDQARYQPAPQQQRYEPAPQQQQQQYSFPEAERGFQPIEDNSGYAAPKPSSLL